MISDLHCHLDGSLSLSTLQELAEARGISLPAQLCFYAGMGLQEALSRFAITLSVLQSPESVRRVAREIVETAWQQGVRTLEIRFAPQLHQGGTLEQMVNAALKGLQGRAGLILCGLYGENPEVLEQLVDVAAGRGVVGIDLAGGPLPEHRWKMRDYAPAFRRAAALGLGRTVHAGEGRPPSEIKEAILEMQAQRIGHGTTILEDPQVVALAIERKITLEACITSNVHTGVITNPMQHPLPRWLDRRHPPAGEPDRRPHGPVQGQLET